MIDRKLLARVDWVGKGISDAIMNASQASRVGIADPGHLQVNRRHEPSSQTSCLSRPLLA